MITINIKEKEYQFPNSKEDLTIEYYKKFVCLYPIYSDSGTTNTMKTVQTISHICDVSVGEVLFANIKELDKVTDALSIVFSLIEDLHKEKEIKIEEINETVTIGDQTYYIKKDLKNLTAGEQLAFEQMIIDNQNFVHCIAPMVALLLRTEKDGEFDYNMYPSFIKKVEKECNIFQIFDISAFFLTSAFSFMNDITSSLTEEAEKTQSNSMGDGDGTHS